MQRCSANRCWRGRLHNALWRTLWLAPAGLVARAARRRYLRWGATPLEVEMGLPGDDLMPAVDLTATRAITIRAPSSDVWPWLAQLGQGRGGFYSYDVLENLVGLDIHSAHSIVPEWQSVQVGDPVNFSSQAGLTVAVVQAGHALVLRGGAPMGSSPSPYDFTWAFVLHDAADGTTRLVVRERYSYARPWARFMVEPVEVVSFVMSQRMLRGIKARAERSARPVLVAAG